MKTTNKILLGVLLLSAVLGLWHFQGNSGKPARQQEMKTPAQNTSTAVMAPDFTLPDMDGKEVRLSDQRGKRVLINFWTTWCGYCKEEMPLIQRLHQQGKAKNWQVLTINITSTEQSSQKVKSYIDSNGFTFPVLLDQKGSVTALYGVKGIPASFILNESGEVVRTKVGPFSENEIADLLK